MSELKILALVEATTINAVARNVLDFQRDATELHETDHTFPSIKISIVTFIRQDPSGASENHFIAAARSAGMRVDVISERSRFDRRIIPALRTIVAEEKPDIIVSHSVKSHFVMLRSKLWTVSPWIAYHHGYTTTDLKMRFYNLFDRRSLPNADRVITVCKAFADELAMHKRVPRERISILHNSIRPQPPVSESEVYALREKLGIKSESRVVISIGRMSKEKAQADLIRAFARFAETNSDLKTKLVIVGDGPERARLIDQTVSEDIAERVVFAGHVNDVRPYYAMADVLANASHSEGSPYVLLEAMAAGLPIVATAVGGVPEMLADGETALLVPPRNPRRLGEALARALTDEDLRQRLAANAGALIKTHFSPDTYVRSVVGIYRDIMANRASIKS